MIKKIKKIIYFFYKPIKQKRKFRQELLEYNNLAKDNKALIENLYPCLNDATSVTEIEPMYFFQDAWGFERIFNDKPSNHIDIGSSHKLVSFLSKVTDLTMVDIRPLAVQMDSINFKKGDILKLPFDNDSIQSLSSLCVIEHIGLGRYGDQIDPIGSEKAFQEIDRVLKIGANFYFTVPVENSNKVYFNAHRAFREDYLLVELLGNYEVLNKKYIYGNEFVDEIRPSIFGIGCYHLKKI